MDWLGLARSVVITRRVTADLFEEAVQETALAGWVAAQRWRPDVDTEFRSYVWNAMFHGLVDWLRTRHGREGKKGAWEAGLKRFDERTDDPAHVCDGFARAEARADLLLTVRRAGLSLQEQEWVDVILRDLPQRTLMTRWAVNESRPAQVKRSALVKLRAAA